MVAAMIVVFAITAIAGIILAALHFGNKNLPLSIAVFHGVFAVTGLIILITKVVNQAKMGVLSFSLVLFILAAIGGLTLFFGFYLPKKKLPTTIIGLHALFAVVGFVLVIVYVLPH